MRFSRRFALLAVFTFLTSAWTISVLLAAEKNSSFHAALESIQSGELGVYVGALADDAMEGREAGTRGGLAAAEYLAEQYQKLHLRGAGDDAKFLQSFAPNFRNVLAFFEGSDPKLRDQVIVVSAHYDHVGYGNHGTSRGPSGYIHPGADDNASGTSAVLELAKAFSRSFPHRRNVRSFLPHGMPRKKACSVRNTGPPIRRSRSNASRP